MEIQTYSLGGKLMKFNYPKLTVICGVKHTFNLFSNDVYKITVVNQMVTAHKKLYNLFGFGIYHKPHYIFKSKSMDFTVVTSVYSAVMIIVWLVISLECTETRALRKILLLTIH